MLRSAACLLFALTSVSAFAQTSTASVSGTVRRASDQLPLAGVEVALLSTTGTAAWRAFTAADGRYRVDVAAGSYRVFTSNRQGFVDEVAPGMACPGRQCSLAGATVVTLAANQNVGQVDFALDRGGAIVGTVRRAGGTPIAAAVTAFNANGAPVARTTTTTGSYVLDGLPAGNYFVRFGASGYTSELHGDVSCPDLACNVASSPAINVVAGELTPGIDATLSGTGLAAGETVVYLNPCEGGCVVWAGTDDSKADTSTTVRDAGGRALPAMDLARYAALAQCVRGRYSAYRLVIASEDPGDVPHREQMVSQTTSFEYGIGPGFDGTVSDFCRAEIATSVSFTFAQGVNDPAALCLTSAHEFGHQFSLDHTLHGPDVMSHQHEFEQSFVDVTAPCGEEGQARPCRCGGTTTNSHQVLASVIGLRGVSDRLFGDDFE